MTIRTMTIRTMTIRIATDSIRRARVARARTTTLTTHMTTEHRRSRVVLGSGIVTLALLFTACSGGGSDSVDSGSTLTVPEAAITTTEPATTSSASTTTPRPEAADALAAAVASLGTRYAFRSDITTAVGDQVVVVGTRVDDSSMFSIEAGGATIDVIVIADAVWIRQDGVGLSGCPRRAPRRSAPPARRSRSSLQLGHRRPDEV